MTNTLRDLGYVDTSRVWERLQGPECVARSVEIIPIGIVLRRTRNPMSIDVGIFSKIQKSFDRRDRHKDDKKESVYYSWDDIAQLNRITRTRDFALTGRQQSARERDGYWTSSLSRIYLQRKLNTPRLDVLEFSQYVKSKRSHLPESSEWRIDRIIKMSIHTRLKWNRQSTEL